MDTRREPTPQELAHSDAEELDVLAHQVTHQRRRSYDAPTQRLLEAAAKAVRAAAAAVVRAR